MGLPISRRDRGGTIQGDRSDQDRRIVRDGWRNDMLIVARKKLGPGRRRGDDDEGTARPRLGPCRINTHGPPRREPGPAGPGVAAANARNSSGKEVHGVIIP
jgi:hypothetical protein